MARTARPKSKSTTILAVTVDNAGNFHHTETTTTMVTGGRDGAYSTVTKTTAVALADGTFRRDFQITYRGGRTIFESHPVSTEAGLEMIRIHTGQYDAIAALPKSDEPITRTLRKRRA